MNPTPPLSLKTAHLYQTERTAYLTWTQKTTRENFAAWNKAKDTLVKAVKAERKWNAIKTNVSCGKHHAKYYL